MSEDKKGKGKTKPPECRICRTKRGVISKYSLKICRRCFKEIAEDMGFRKFG